MCVQALCLSVEPGFGGQKFQPEAMTKVRKLRDAFPALQLEVDGGISPSTIDQVVGRSQYDLAVAVPGDLHGVHTCLLDLSTFMLCKAPLSSLIAEQRTAPHNQH